MLKNTYKKGLKFELSTSLQFHGEGIPLLISPLLLRRNNAGQADLARLIYDESESEWVIELIELKSFGFNAYSPQRDRLKCSVRLLQSIFNLRFEFSYVFDKKPPYN